VRKSLRELAVGVALLASPALAGEMSVSHATLRVISPATPAAGYFDIRNLENWPLTLVGASSPACGSLMMHRSSTAGGMASMRDAGAIILAPRQTVRFQPGGLHLMCMDPSPSLMSARTVPVRLLLRHYQPVDVVFTVTDALGHPHR